MNEFNERFEGLSPPQKQERYLRLAEACLRHYPEINGEITFVAHNAGIVYRVESAQGKYLLKIAQATGEGEIQTLPAPITSGFVWLDAIARETDLTVQRPVANQQGEFVTAVDYEDLSEPFYSTLQYWLEGEHPRNPTPEHAYQIGAMMAELHLHGSGWIQGKTLDAWTYDEAGSQENFERFAKVKPLTILSDAEWANVEKAVERMLQVMQRLGRESQVWVPIHGDIHHANLLIVDGKMCPIDFSGLVLGHYAYDLGVTLYHFMYLDAATRQALIDGYRSKRELFGLLPMDLEAFLCATALANLAFNVELPDQRTSALFIRNVREFATVFCEKLIHDIPFALEDYEYIR